ncbi:hypothetical protein KAR48_00120 [bacterium]|nr:hypothetical protein [bacterium]
MISNNFRGKIIIGIHGLNNKPPGRMLRRWWKQSLRHGLTLNGTTHPFMRFDLAYWASVRYAEPLNPNEEDVEHELYLEEPYIPLAPATPEGAPRMRKVFLDLLEASINLVFLNKDLTLNLSVITDSLVKKRFHDLFLYFSKEKSPSGATKGDLIRRPLIHLLCRHRRKKIMLIAHSMGSIVAYDILKRYVPHIQVDTFVTVGSPLGLPIFIHRNAMTGCDLGQRKPCVPDNICTAWHNLSDLHDPIAMNYNLGDDYTANQTGVGVTDWEVHNRYIHNDEHNPHKSFGYLQCPELAQICHKFLKS